MKTRSWGWSVWVCALSIVSASAGAVGCGGSGVPVQSPIVVQSGRTQEQTEQAILEVLPRRGWTAESVQPGRVVAFLSIRTHLLRVDIRYDAQRASLFYVNSDNLAAHVEADGQVYAHRNVNRWIQLLSRDIASELALAPQTGAGGVGPAVQPAPAPGQPAPGQPAPGQPAPGQPAPGQPAPGQPAPGQPAPYLVGPPLAPPAPPPLAAPAAPLTTPN